VRRFLAAAALLAATITYQVMHPPVNLSEGRGVLRHVPEAFGPWQGTELGFDDAVTDELRADDMVIRRYDDGPRSVWLCMVFHQNRHYGAHDPHLCYESQGYTMGPEGHAHLDDGTPAGLDVNTFVAERAGRRRVVWYWWTTQGLTTADADAFRRRMALLGALDNRSWGSFVRVESVARDGDMAAATARVRDFATRAAAALPVVFARALRVQAARP